MKCAPQTSAKVFLPLVLFLICIAQSHKSEAALVDYYVDGKKCQAYLAKPKGDGPFPAVIYNHGIIVDKVGYERAVQSGYRMVKICQILTEDGFLVFGPIRKSGIGNLSSHKQEVHRAIDYVKTMSDVDSSRIALMGFSRGGLLTLMVGTERNDLAALLILAPAPGEGYFGRALEHISKLTSSVLLLVESNDSPPILKDFRSLEHTLKIHGKDVESICYDRGGGHKLFWDVGYYWQDIKDFLDRKLKSRV